MDQWRRRRHADRAVESDADVEWNKIKAQKKKNKITKFISNVSVLYPLLDIFPFQFQFRYWQCISIPFILPF